MEKLTKEDFDFIFDSIDDFGTGELINGKIQLETMEFIDGLIKDDAPEPIKSSSAEKINLLRVHLLKKLKEYDIVKEKKIMIKAKLLSLRNSLAVSELLKS